MVLKIQVPNIQDRYEVLFYPGSFGALPVLIPKDKKWMSKETWK